MQAQVIGRKHAVDLLLRERALGRDFCGGGDNHLEPRAVIAVCALPHSSGKLLHAVQICQVELQYLDVAHGVATRALLAHSAAALCHAVRSICQDVKARRSTSFDIPAADDHGRAARHEPACHRLANPARATSHHTSRSGEAA